MSEAQIPMDGVETMRAYRAAIQEWLKYYLADEDKKVEFLQPGFVRLGGDFSINDLSLVIDGIKMIMDRTKEVNARIHESLEEAE